MPDISYAGASATQTRRKERGKSSATDPTSSAEPDHNSSSNRGEKKAEYIKLNFPVLGTIDKAFLPEEVYPILRKGNLVKFCRVWAKLTSYWMRRLIRGPPALSLSKCTKCDSPFKSEEDLRIHIANKNMNIQEILNIWNVY